MMSLPDADALIALLAPKLGRFDAPPAEPLWGRIEEVGPVLMRATLPDAGLGELCLVDQDGLEAEVVGIDGAHVLLSPFAEPVGLRAGCAVRGLGHGHRIAVGPHLLGCVVDGIGRMLKGEVPRGPLEYRALEAFAPNPLLRTPISTPLPVGVRAIDGLLTCGRGQRMGIFAAAGGGKSSLLGMMCDGTEAEVIVLALIGERGREVREFLDNVLTPESRPRTVVVVATSDRPALERLKAAYTATTIAEYFRDQGKDVLLMMDSLTRFARANREIGLAAGEPPTAGSFPPSFFARLPRLLERAGPAPVGSITGIYTVLVEGDNMNEPVADEVRSILDGHIVLSRKLAQESHYPAIDIPASISRVMTQVVTPEHAAHASRLRRLLGLYADVELLVRVGEYQRGNDAETDEAIDRRAAIRGYLVQGPDERASFDEELAMLEEVVSAPC